MTLISLTTSETVIVERENIPKTYIFSTAGFANALEYVLLRIGPGEADVLLSANGTSLVTLEIPPGMQVFAWASAGTPKIAVNAL